MYIYIYVNNVFAFHLTDKINQEQVRGWRCGCEVTRGKDGRKNDTVIMLKGEKDGGGPKRR